jgi:type IV pilus assembly protein PilW
VPPGYIPTTSQTHELLVTGYYVSTTSTLSTPGNPVPSLRRHYLRDGPAIQLNEEVLPGVEDMQVQFGIDTDPVGAVNRGSIDRYVNGDDPIFDPMSPAFLPTAKILAVRIWLRIRAERPENGFDDSVNNYRYADQDFTPPPGDSFRRIVVSKTIYLRNARPPI